MDPEEVAKLEAKLTEINLQYQMYYPVAFWVEVCVCGRSFGETTANPSPVQAIIYGDASPAMQPTFENTERQRP